MWTAAVNGLKQGGVWRRSPQFKADGEHNPEGNLVEAVSCLVKGETPDLNWITYDESLPACSTP